MSKLHIHIIYTNIKCEDWATSKNLCEDFSSNCSGGFRVRLRRSPPPGSYNFLNCNHSGSATELYYNITCRKYMSTKFATLPVGLWIYTCTGSIYKIFLGKGGIWNIDAVNIKYHFNFSYFLFTKLQSKTSLWNCDVSQSIHLPASTILFTCRSIVESIEELSIQTSHKDRYWYALPN